VNKPLYLTEEKSFEETTAKTTTTLDLEEEEGREDPSKNDVFSLAKRGFFYPSSPWPARGQRAARLRAPKVATTGETKTTTKGPEEEEEKGAIGKKCEQ